MRAEVLVGPERRRRWSADEKRRIVREAFEGGGCVAEVARRRDVSRAQIYQWRAALRDEEALTGVGGGLLGFMPVEVSTTPPPPLRSAPDPHAMIEVGLAGGRSLRVPASLSTAALRRLIRVVEGA